MVELEPVELVLQAPNLVAVGFHLRVAAVGVLHDLVDDKLLAVTLDDVRAAGAQMISGPCAQATIGVTAAKAA